MLEEMERGDTSVGGAGPGEDTRDGVAQGTGGSAQSSHGGLGCRMRPAGPHHSTTRNLMPMLHSLLSNTSRNSLPFSPSPGGQAGCGRQHGVEEGHEPAHAAAQGACTPDSQHLLNSGGWAYRNMPTHNTQDAYHATRIAFERVACCRLTTP